MFCGEGASKGKMRGLRRRGSQDERGKLAKRLDLTTESVTNFIFHFTVLARAQNHASDQLHFTEQPVKPLCLQAMRMHGLASA